MRKQRFMDKSTFICPVCRNTFPLMRPHGQKRKKGHIKDIWCPWCEKEQQFMEIRRKDWYLNGNGEVVYM